MDAAKNRKSGTESQAGPMSEGVALRRLLIDLVGNTGVLWERRGQLRLGDGAAVIEQAGEAGTGSEE